MYNFSFFKNLKNFISKSYKLINKKFVKQIGFNMSYFLKDNFQPKIAQLTFFLFSFYD